jgi:hypothetical protein
MYCVCPSLSLRPLGLGLGFLYLYLGALYTTRFLNLIGLYLVALLGLYDEPPPGDATDATAHAIMIPAIKYIGHNQ